MIVLENLRIRVPLVARGLSVLVGGLWLGWSVPGQATPSASLPPPAWGSDGPGQRCVNCHSFERGGPFRVAPNLWGIVGADIARHDWFGYSPALKKKPGRWSESMLDDYLADPLGFVPGTKKSMLPIRDPAERRELIDFLKTLRD